MYILYVCVYIVCMYICMYILYVCVYIVCMYICIYIICVYMYVCIPACGNVAEFSITKKSELLHRNVISHV